MRCCAVGKNEKANKENRFQSSISSLWWACVDPRAFLAADDLDTRHFGSTIGQKKIKRGRVNGVTQNSVSFFQNLLFLLPEGCVASCD